MNYTFLPNSEKGSLVREYRVRALIVLIFFISVSLVVGIASLFPAYIYSSIEERIHLRQVADLQKTSDDATVTAIQKQLLASSALLNTVSSNINSNIYAKVVSSIVALRGNIVLTSFALEHPSANTVTAVVSGVAGTRDDLLAFKARLQSLPGKTSVDLPLSTLAQDSKISFSIQINEVLQ